MKQKDREGVEEFARKNSSTVEGEYARRVLREEVSESSVQVSFSIGNLLHYCDEQHAGQLLCSVLNLNAYGIVMSKCMSTSV